VSAPGVLVLRIPREAPSGNDLRRKYRHPHAYKALRELWRDELLAAVSAVMKGRRWAPWGYGDRRQRLTVVRSYSRRALDRDGAVAGLKPILDCLSVASPRRNPDGLGLIRDDSETWIDLKVEQVKAAEPFVEIRLEPIA
jgi:hypothetical protein